MKKHITTLYPRDRQALTALSRTGYIDDNQLHQFWRDKRIKSYLKDGLLAKDRVSSPGHREKARICYKLTTAGRELCRKELGMENMYRAQSPVHDLALADRYFTLTKEEQASWRTETEVKNQLEEHLHQMRQDPIEALWANRIQQDWEQGKLSMPDAVYTNAEGIEVAFEVVTNHYGRAEIEAKQTVANLLDLKYEEERI